MMILDGCFILEIARECKGDYDDNDPIFGYTGNHNMLPYILRDMLILENQIPMMVLRTLWQDEKGDEVITLMVFSLKLVFL
jgi:hypothetical protein